MIARPGRTRVRAIAAGLMAVVAVGASACGGSGSSEKTTDAGDGKALADGGAITVAIPQDPGSLDPQHVVTSAGGQLVAFAYDSLVHVDTDGEIQSGLASEWKQSGNTYTFTIKTGVTCSDGSAMTPELVARNINYLSDPDSRYPLLGVYLPPDVKATADKAAGTVTVKTRGSVAFFLNGIAAVPMVCASGLDEHRTMTRRSDGTGPYVLSETVANDHYTYTLRKGYAWGPDGASTAERGMPDKITFKVVANETTAANLLLSNQIHIAGVAGPDRARLESLDLHRYDIHNIEGEMFFNEAAGRPASDERVRRALVMALDLPKLGSVLTDGEGTPATGMVTLQPTACKYDAVTGNLPEHDLDGAKALLDEAGWSVGSDGIREKDGKPLSLVFLYGTTQTMASAAELALQQWRELGVKIESQSKPDTAIGEILFSTGTWDITWNSLQVQFPSQIVPFLSGATPADGTNFAHLSNKTYSEQAAIASAKPGSTGCDDWQKAEAALVKSVDVVPYYNKVYPVWGRGVTFVNNASGLIPTTLRVLAD